jgi:hypothetical protein
MSGQVAPKGSSRLPTQIMNDEGRYRQSVNRMSDASRCRTSKMCRRVQTLDFISGEHTQRGYTRAKVIDMAFFIEGMT